MGKPLIHGKSLQDWYSSHPLLRLLTSHKELFWLNENLAPFDSVRNSLELKQVDIDNAADRFQRFAPLLCRLFPETKPTQGLVTSPLQNPGRLQQELSDWSDHTLPPRLLIKRDDQLPIARSIKARGGVYEVLKHAEELAVEEGFLTRNSSCEALLASNVLEFLSNHQIMVGSTGNLGLSIGITGARLGFEVTVHMSADAKRWKKNLLRHQGVTVVEHQRDYSEAVAQGRKESDQTENCYFIDDESSPDLFLGYSVAAAELKQQLEQQSVTVNSDHPLFVYLPCGVGGGPGGITFGLKHLFGDNVHCFFIEPTHSPCMFTGMYTELFDTVTVQDFGLDNITCADGLAVGRPSSLAGRLMSPLVDGIFTVNDNNLYRYLAQIWDSENISLEPSAAAGLAGYLRLAKEVTHRTTSHYPREYIKHATHIIWSTGGGMVPKEEFETYYQQGKFLQTAG